MTTPGSPGCLRGHKAKQRLAIIPVETVDEVLDAALEPANETS